jgi:adenylate cyclase
MDWETTDLLAGAADVNARRALLDYLHGLGYDGDLMAAAAARGRLYALAGDQGIRPGLPSLTCADLADRLHQDVEWVQRLWRALGLTEQDGPLATEDEVEGLTIWSLLRSLLGDQDALALARVHGAAVARMAEAVAAVMTNTLPDIDLAHSGDELTTAQAYAAATDLLPQAIRCVDVIYRQHLGSAIRHFEASAAPGGFGPHGVPYSIAFADLCGFTSATEQLSTAELAALLEVFEGTSYEEAAAVGGRCVKLIGDAAMFVAASPDVLTEIASRVVERMTTANEKLPVRVGMARGDVVVRGGDYFGQPVNLAARLLSLAKPGTILADHRLAAALDASRWQRHPQEPQTVKGINTPVRPHIVERTREGD